MERKELALHGGTRQDMSLSQTTCSYSPVTNKVMPRTPKNSKH